MEKRLYLMLFACMGMITMISSYSRQYRIFMLKFQYDEYDQLGEIVKYDPLFDDLEEIVQFKCTMRYCQNINSIVSDLRLQYGKQLENEYEMELMNRYLTDRGDWLKQSDPTSHASVEKSLILQSYLANVFENINVSESLKSLNHEFGIELYRITPDILQDLTIRLFSTEKYFLCFTICEIYHHLYYHDEIFSSEIRSLILISQTMALSAALFGNLKLATLSVLKVIHYYRQYIHVPQSFWHFTSSIEGITALHRLRLILLHPPIPLGDLQNPLLLETHRTEMEQDIRLLIQDISARKITVTLEVYFHIFHSDLV